MADSLKNSSVDGFELNFSCPNVKSGKGPVGDDDDVISGIISDIKKITNIPLFAKFGYGDSLNAKAKVSSEAGIDGITAINCPRGMKIDINTGKPFLKEIRRSGRSLYKTSRCLFCLYTQKRISRFTNNRYRRYNELYRCY